jgi:hypothetical protein
MVLKALAIELYRAQQTVHALEDRLRSCSLNEQDDLRRKLQTARAERDQLRRLVEARKEPPPFRRTFQDRR